MKFFSRPEKAPPVIPTNWSAMSHSESADLEVGYEAALPFLSSQLIDFDTESTQLSTSNTKPRS